MNFKTIFTSAFAIIVLGCAGNASNKKELENKKEPHVYNIRNYGAKGDGKTINTKAINKAISEAAKNGGGTVFFPSGTYLSASIQLKSNITIYLDAGAILEAVNYKLENYDLPEPNETGKNYQEFGHNHMKNSLIWGIGLENISIIGTGIIYGKGLTAHYDRFADRSKGEIRFPEAIPGEGNKAIGLKGCNNVLLRDFSILFGGHFGIKATGITNMTIDNLKIDTNRDGMDFDGCTNVRVSNCSVNSPFDDGICLKASYALGRVQDCENITITNCYLSGNYDVGTMLDGTFKRSLPEYKSNRNGRIKMGTESNGDFKNISISNCVFDEAAGIAIESVDGSNVEDIAISNITMRNVSTCPIFIRLGSRMRGPENTPIGTIKRIIIDNVVAYNSNGYFASIITGIPNHPIEDIRVSNVRFNHEGGGTKEDGEIVPPENERKYPDPGMFGKIPAYGFFIRHVEEIEMHHVKIDYNKKEERPVFVLEDVKDAYFEQINAKPGSSDAPTFDLRNTSDFSIINSRNIKDTKQPDLLKKSKI